AAERGVHDHRVADRGLGDNAAGGEAAGGQAGGGAGRAAGQGEPDPPGGGGQRGGGARQGEGPADRPGGGGGGGGSGGPRLAAAARAGAGAAAQVGRLFQGDLAVGEAGAEGLDLARVLALLGREGDAAGHEHARQVGHRGQGHHHGGQALVAGGDAEHAAARRQRADQAAQDLGGVVAVGQAVHHARGALGAAGARVGAEAGEGQGAQGAQFLGGRLHEQADLPVAGVIAQRDGRAVRGADAALGAEDEELLAAQFGRVPAHAGVLCQAEEVAAGGV